MKGNEVSKKKDPFLALRPKREEVAVGNHEMILTTATLDQEARFLKVVEGLDLDKLIKPLGEVIRGAQAGEDGKNFIDVVADNGAAIWQAARTVFGTQLAPSVRAGCVALLDSKANLELLMKSGAVDPVEAETQKEVGADGEFLGSPHVRIFISENLTLLQGFKIITTAWSINGYSDLLGNLVAPLTVAQP